MFNAISLLFDISHITDERNKLENFNKKLFSFREKSKRLSEMKESFLLKMEDAEREENIEGTKTYYVALLRTVRLSYNVYHAMFEVIKKDLSESGFIENSNKNEIIEFFNLYEKVRLEQEHDIVKKNEILRQIEAMKKSFLESDINMHKFIEEIRFKLTKIIEDNSKNIELIESKIDEEKKILENLANRPQTFFQELESVIDLHKRIEEEKAIEQQINKEITDLFNVAEKYLGKGNSNLKEDFNVFTKVLTFLNQDYERTKIDITPGFNFLLQKGEVLEKHASKFAGVVVLLSGVSAIASLAGLGVAAAVFSSAFGIVATGGEMLQSLPYVKNNILPKLDNRIKKVFTNNF